MPGLMNEYISKRFGAVELESELLKLISAYNKERDSYLLVYSTAIGKPIPEVSLIQADYFLIHDLLKDKNRNAKVDVYIETPGGSGETAEEIVRFLHDNFETVSFVISGEAKSAGTIIALSGDEIIMSETGSLGPIDAQMKIGRSVISAYDYMEWVEGKRKEAGEQGRLNPFDATMVAQITPGELGSVFHALKFAEDLVVDWLIRYKFKNWTVTKTRGIPVTDDMKRNRAQEIAAELTNHSKWRSHGRSIKRGDLDDIGLEITKLEGNPKLSDIVYRIQTVCRMLFNVTNTFKIFATADGKIFKSAMPAGMPLGLPLGLPVSTMQKPDIAQAEVNCPQCGAKHRMYAKFSPQSRIDKDLQRQGFTPFPKDAKLKCKCGFVIDLSGLKNQLEIQTEKKIIT